METALKTKTLTMVQAITDGLDTMLRENENVLLMGEDIGVNGGVFRATEGLQRKYGEDRVLDTPLSEAGFIGAALGISWIHLSCVRTNHDTCIKNQGKNDGTLHRPYGHPCTIWGRSKGP